MRLLCACVMLVLTLACAGEPRGSLQEGRWHAWLDSPGGPLPFELEITGEDGELGVRIINGDERIRVPRVEAIEDRLVLGMDHYDSRIEASVQDQGRALDGLWSKTRLRRPARGDAVPRHGRLEPPVRDDRPGRRGSVGRTDRWTLERALRQRRGARGGPVRVGAGRNGAGHLPHHDRGLPLPGGQLLRWAAAPVHVRRRARIPVPRATGAGRGTPRRFLVARQLARHLDGDARSGGGVARRLRADQPDRRG